MSIMGTINAQQMEQKSQVWWHASTSVVPALERPWQEDHEFKVKLHDEFLSQKFTTKNTC